MNELRRGWAALFLLSYRFLRSVGMRRLKYWAFDVACRLAWSRVLQVGIKELQKANRGKE